MKKYSFLLKKCSLGLIALSSFFVVNIPCIEKSQARVIGRVSVSGYVRKSRIGMIARPNSKLVWSAHWGSAYSQCKAGFPATQSVRLITFDVKNQHFLQSNVISYWACQDNP